MLPRAVARHHHSAPQLQAVGQFLAPHAPGDDPDGPPEPCSPDRSTKGSLSHVSRRNIDLIESIVPSFLRAITGCVSGGFSTYRQAAVTG